MLLFRVLPILSRYRELVHLSQFWLRAFRSAKVLSCVPSVWIASQTEYLRSTTTQTPSMGKRNLRDSCSRKTQTNYTDHFHFPLWFQKNIINGQMFPPSSKFFSVVSFHTQCIYLQKKIQGWFTMSQWHIKIAQFSFKVKRKIQTPSQTFLLFIGR